MKTSFTGYYSLSTADFKTLWDKAVFIFDTNVLLNLYRYPASISDQLLSHMNRLEGRVWLPFHVALEFQRNRPKVIADQRKTFKEVRASIDAKLCELRNHLQGLSKRHSTIHADQIINEIEKVLKKVDGELEAKERSYPEVADLDRLREKLDALFDGKIGQEPESQESLNSLIKDGENRIKYKIPPGFQDQHKAEGEEGSAFSYGEITYERKFGDLIVWKQIIEHCRNNGLKHVVFVTDDEKEDWWWIIKSAGPKTLGPRPELARELTVKAGVELFHMYKSDSFLGHASQHFATDLPEDVVEQVAHLRKFEKRFPQSVDLMSEHTVFDAVRDWIRKRHNGFALSSSRKRRLVRVMTSLQAVASYSISIFGLQSGNTEFVNIQPMDDGSYPVPTEYVFLAVALTESAMSEAKHAMNWVAQSHPNYDVQLLIPIESREGMRLVRHQL